MTILIGGRNLRQVKMPPAFRKSTRIYKCAYFIYHFGKFMVPMYKTQKVSGKFSVGSSETKCVGKKKLRWLNLGPPEQTRKFIVFNRLPGAITDTKKPYSLSAGDTVGESDICVFDYHSFEKYIGIH